MAPASPSNGGKVVAFATNVAIDVQGSPEVENVSNVGSQAMCHGYTGNRRSIWNPTESGHRKRLLPASVSLIAHDHVHSEMANAKV